MKQIKIDIADKGNAAVSPVDYLNGTFDAYRRACSRASYRFDAASKANVGPFADLPALVGALVQEGFAPVLTAAAAREAERLAADASAAPSIDAKLEAQLALSPAKPFDYQLDGVRYLMQGDAHLLHDDMGLGKTLQVLLSVPAGAGVVVVCPASVKGSWAREVKQWRPDLTAVVLSGKGSFRWPSAGEVIVTNYDILPEDCGMAPRGTIVTIDEAHYAKSFKAARTKRVRAICAAARKNGGRASLLTGTPMLNQPGELWTVLQTVGLGTKAFGNYDRFKALFGGVETAYGVEWKGEISPDAARILAMVAFGRRKEDVLKSLPEKRRETVPVALAGAALKQVDAEFKRLPERFKVIDGVLMVRA